MSKIFRAAVVQAAPMAFDLQRSLERVDRYCQKAKAEGAELIVFPEAFLGGYPKGSDFGIRVGMRSDAGRRQFQRYFDNALRMPGPELEQLIEMVRELDIVLVIGVIERDQGRTLYCTALTIDPTGIIGKRRKVMPTAMERTIWGFGDGRDVRATATRVGRVGAAICWENYMPQLRLRLYQDQVELYCAPTVDDRESWLASMRHIACEGRCFVLSACQFATRADYPDDYESAYADAPDTVLIGGGSCIIDPFGRVLAGPAESGCTVLTADLDRGAITQGKFDLDVVGHYARPDLFDAQ